MEINDGEKLYLVTSSGIPVAGPADPAEMDRLVGSIYAGLARMRLERERGLKPGSLKGDLPKVRPRG